MNNNIFPLPFSVHLVFSCIAFLFFIFQFTRVKRKYQLIMAVAVPATLLLYVNSSKTWFYILGIAEFILMIAALITAIIEKRKEKALTAEQADKNSEESVQE
ncbi:MAG: hypothetical protein K2I33_03720 [Oscillospiraceae bacterium]|nr:hypothetical protein [Oscillospiraceae bacterium]